MEKKHVPGLLTLTLLIISCFGCELMGSSEEGPELTSRGEDAYSFLANTNFYGALAAGIVAVPSREAQEFGALYLEREEVRKNAFDSLLKHGSPAGQLYALTGFYLTDPDRYRKAAAPFRHSQREVETAGGCVLYKAKVADLIEHIDDGTYPQAILAAAGIEVNGGEKNQGTIH